MAYRYKNRNVKSGFVLHIPKSVKGLFRRFSFGILIFIAVLALLVGKSENNTVSYIRVKILDAMSPVLDVVALPLEIARNSGGALSSYFFVHSKNAKLEEDNKRLKIQLVRLYQTQKENVRLKKLLNFVKTLEYQYISAKVVGNASGPFARSVLINAGEDDGILKGQAVVMDGGLVGRVVEVGTHSSRVLLLTDINSKISVMSLDSRERSILSGNNDANPKLIYLPKESKITDGEVIVTSGDGAILPPGIMVGNAHKLSDGSYEIVPFVKWHNLEYVSVLGLKND